MTESQFLENHLNLNEQTQNSKHLTLPFQQQLIPKM